MYIYRWEVRTVDRQGNTLVDSEIPVRFVRKKSALQYMLRMRRIHDRFHSTKKHRLFDRKTEHWSSVWIVED